MDRRDHPTYSQTKQHCNQHQTNTLLASQPIGLKPLIPITMFSPGKLVALASALPAALACLGYEGGVPTATDSKTLSAPMRIKAGQVFDAGWVKYDRGSGACGDGEGG